MSFKCGRCEKGFQSYNEKVQHEEKAINHWKCQRVSKGGDKHCNYVGSSFGSLFNHWELEKCHLYCEQCKEGWMSPSELSKHCGSDKHKVAKLAFDIQRGLRDDPGAALSKQPKARKKKPKKTLSAVLPAPPPPRAAVPARLPDKQMSRASTGSAQMMTSRYAGPSVQAAPPQRYAPPRSEIPPRSMQAVPTGLRFDRTKPSPNSSPFHHRNHVPAAPPARNIREERMTGDGPAKKQAWSVDQIHEAQRAQERYLPKLEASQKARAPTVKVAGGNIEPATVYPQPEHVETPTPARGANYPESKHAVSSPAPSLLDDDTADQVFLPQMPVLSPLKSPMIKPQRATQPLTTNNENHMPAQKRPSQQIYAPPAMKPANIASSLRSSQYTTSKGTVDTASQPDGGDLTTSRWAAASDELTRAMSSLRLDPMDPAPQSMARPTVQTPAPRNRVPPAHAPQVASTTDNASAFHSNSFASAFIEANNSLLRESHRTLASVKSSSGTHPRGDGRSNDLTLGGGSGGLMASKYAK